MRYTGLFSWQRKVLVSLLILLSLLGVLNVYLSFLVIKLSQERINGEQVGAWIRGTASYMCEFAVKLTPNKAVFNHEDGLNISVKASYWAPFDSGSRPFYFKVYDKIAYSGSLTIDDSPKLVVEKTVVASKSKNELDYTIPAFNFTVTLNNVETGIHLYTVVGDIWPNVTLAYWDCIATFAINLEA